MVIKNHNFKGESDITVIRKASQFENTGSSINKIPKTSVRKIQIYNNKIEKINESITQRAEDRNLL